MTPYSVELAAEGKMYELLLPLTPHQRDIVLGAVKDRFAREMIYGKVAKQGSEPARQADYEGSDCGASRLAVEGLAAESGDRGAGKRFLDSQPRNTAGNGGGTSS